MKDTENIHLKVQELCDCFASTDPLKEMSDIGQAAEDEESALKWLALAALHGINSNAKKITLETGSGGKTRVKAEYRDSELPSPGDGVGNAVVEAVRKITHIDGSKGESPLALGIKDSSVNLSVKVKDKKDSRKITLEFDNT